ncbi:hypothetical protein K0M31_000501 [Melipona bicolor]|uniref:Uncharacterized protein n=1 Tax=Melipona bicolor TaxID=60889 RepID=A0AA40GDV6_9HYME|nr:hypothetical protein K0M31_000501 [Melipona bicolor]
MYTLNRMLSIRQPRSALTSAKWLPWNSLLARTNARSTIGQHVTGYVASDTNVNWKQRIFLCKMGWVARLTISLTTGSIYWGSEAEIPEHVAIQYPMLTIIRRREISRNIPTTVSRGERRRAEDVAVACI